MGYDPKTRIYFLASRKHSPVHDSQNQDRAPDRTVDAQREDLRKSGTESRPHRRPSGNVFQCDRHVKRSGVSPRDSSAAIGAAPCPTGGSGMLRGGLSGESYVETRTVKSADGHFSPLVGRAVSLCGSTHQWTRGRC